MKKLLSLTCVFLLLILSIIPAFADEISTAEASTDETLVYDMGSLTSSSSRQSVVDEADVFTDEEEASLTAKIEEIRTNHSFDIAIVTTNSIGDATIVEYADDFFDYNGYGCGENKDGLVAVLNLNNGEEGNRGFYTSTHGFGLQAFTDYAIDTQDGAINSAILPDLQNGDWYSAFSTYLDLADVFLVEYEKGTPYDVSNPYKTASNYIIAEVILIVIALAAAIIVTGIMKRKMNTAHEKHEAGEYMKAGSFKVTGGAEVFVRSDIVSTPKPKNTDSGGGSSSHTSSSGESHGGGGMSF